MSEASGLPQQQVPVPSQAPPPQLSIRALPSENGDGKDRGSRITWVVMCVLLQSGCWSAAPGLWGGSGVHGCCAHLSLSPYISRYFLQVR